MTPNEPLALTSGETLAHLLDEGSEFTLPSRALLGLSPELAGRKLEGWPHSCAEVLAHMVFWQDRTLRQVGGETLPPVAHASDGWPAAGADDWEGLVRTSLENLARMKEIARTDDPQRVVSADRTLGVRLMSHLGHDAHHLGQIVFMRRVLGAWPPPGGGDTW